jgi:general transcription factor 3C polypeptide 6
MTAPNSTSAGLFPGYRQVEAFEADEEYELDSEEVVFVTLDVGDVEPSLVPGTSSYRLIVSPTRYCTF